jgi:hypothetical protein
MPRSDKIDTVWLKIIDAVTKIQTMHKVKFEFILNNISKKRSLKKNYFSLLFLIVCVNLSQNFEWYKY